MSLKLLAEEEVRLPLAAENSAPHVSAKVKYALAHSKHQRDRALEEIPLVLREMQHVLDSYLADLQNLYSSIQRVVLGLDQGLLPSVEAPPRRVTLAASGAAQFKHTPASVDPPRMVDRHEGTFFALRREYLRRSERFRSACKILTAANPSLLSSLSIGEYDSDSDSEDDDFDAHAPGAGPPPADPDNLQGNPLSSLDGPISRSTVLYECTRLTLSTIQYPLVSTVQFFELSPALDANLVDIPSLLTIPCLSVTLLARAALSAEPNSVVHFPSIGNFDLQALRAVQWLLEAKQIMHLVRSERAWFSQLSTSSAERNLASRIQRAMDFLWGQSPKHILVRTALVNVTVSEAATLIEERYVEESVVNALVLQTNRSIVSPMNPHRVHIALVLSLEHAVGPNIIREHLVTQMQELPLHPQVEVIFIPIHYNHHYGLVELHLASKEVFSPPSFPCSTSNSVASVLLAFRSVCFSFFLLFALSHRLPFCSRLLRYPLSLFPSFPAAFPLSFAPTWDHSPLCVCQFWFDDSADHDPGPGLIPALHQWIDVAHEVTLRECFLSQLWPAEIKRFQEPMPRQPASSASCAVYVLSTISSRARLEPVSLEPHLVRMERFLLLEAFMAFCNQNRPVLN